VGAVKPVRTCPRGVAISLPTGLPGSS